VKKNTTQWQKKNNRKQQIDAQAQPLINRQAFTNGFTNHECTTSNKTQNLKTKTSTMMRK